VPLPSGPGIGRSTDPTCGDVRRGENVKSPAMRGTILVVNAGSTSLKLAAVDEHDNAIPVASLEAAPPVVAAGHRVVHGGERLVAPTPVGDRVMAELEALVELAPLHNAPALAAIRAAQQALPGIPHVAVFDTAFHATLPDAARTYLLPERFRALGIRRFGFHGLSVQWAAERVVAARLVVCHLGGGASVTAVRNGRSLDTTMGFTPLEGVPMATRGGPVDPGALLYLLRTGVGPADLEQALEHESGLTGLAGTGDVAALERDGSREAALALEIYAYRVAQAVAGMASALGGLDAVVFTGGVGENSARIRRDVCGRLDFLGVELDESANESANETAAGEATVSAPGSTVAVHVVQAREDVVIARAVRSALG
jgi:acetate kinase